MTWCHLSASDCCDVYSSGRYECNSRILPWNRRPEGDTDEQFYQYGSPSHCSSTYDFVVELWN